MSIIFNELKPCPGLIPYVEFFWTGQFNIFNQSFFAQRVIPNGYIELIIHLTDDHCELFQESEFRSSPDYTLIGLFTKPYDVHFRAKVDVFGIRFKPEGIAQLFGIPAAEVQSSFSDMECITGRKFKEYTSRLRETKNLRDRLALSEAYLENNISKRNLNIYYLNRAAEIIRRRKGLISLEELAGSVYISSRQLEREFKEKIGISPKSYMRIARLNEVNRLILNSKKLPLSRVSYDCGYSDQAHFIRDFRKFTGERPAIVMRERDNFIMNPNLADTNYL